MAAFAAAAGIELSYVPFKGAAPALVATVGRHVDIVAPGVSEAITMNEAKKIRRFLPEHQAVAALSRRPHRQGVGI